MDNQLFSHVTGDYYIRHYELDPKFTNGLQVTVYAECSPNTTGMNNHYYALDLYFSADEIPDREHIVGVRKEKMWEDAQTNEYLSGTDDAE